MVGEPRSAHGDDPDRDRGAHGESGSYSKTEIESVLVTANTGLRAAALESRRMTGTRPEPAVIVHTGWWGCRAFSGNRVLMGRRPDHRLRTKCGVPRVDEGHVPRTGGCGALRDDRLCHPPGTRLSRQSILPRRRGSTLTRILAWSRVVVRSQATKTSATWLCFSLTIGVELEPKAEALESRVCEGSERHL